MSNISNTDTTGAAPSVKATTIDLGGICSHIKSKDLSTYFKNEKTYVLKSFASEVRQDGRAFPEYPCCPTKFLPTEQDIDPDTVQEFKEGIRTVFVGQNFGGNFSTIVPRGTTDIIDEKLFTTYNERTWGAPLHYGQLIKKIARSKGYPTDPIGYLKASLHHSRHWETKEPVKYPDMYSHDYGDEIQWNHFESGIGDQFENAGEGKTNVLDAVYKRIQDDVETYLSNRVRGGNGSRASRA